MASVPANPIFVADLPTLKSSLRLAEIKDDEDVDSILSDVIRTVRSGFQRRLGIARVTTIVGYVYDPTAGAATTTNEMVREVANLTEVDWCRKLLYERLPLLFRDSSGESMLSWNRDALTRESNSEQRRDAIDALTASIEENLLLLAGGIQQPTYHAHTFEPTADQTPVLGGSVFGPDGSIEPHDG